MRGITAIIAVILLLMISIAIVGFAYFFLTGVVQTATNETSTQLEKQTSTFGESFAVESVNGYQVVIRNRGTAPLKNSSISFYLNNKKIDVISGPNTIQPNSVGIFTVDENDVPGTNVAGTLKVSSSGFTEQKSVVFNESNQPLCTPTYSNECDSTSSNSCGSRTSNGNYNLCPLTNPDACGNEIGKCSDSTDNDCDGLTDAADSIDCPAEISYAYTTVADWRFGEGDNATATDSANNIKGKIYGDTRLLMHFDEGSGTKTSDKTNYGNNGSCSGASCPVWVSGKTGNALSFDGINDYIKVPDNASIAISGSNADISLEAWIYPRTYPNPQSWGGIVTKSLGTGGFIGYGLFIYSPSITNPLTVYFAVGDEISGVPNAKYQNINPNQWYHVVGTYDHKYIKLYVNGVLQASNPLNVSIINIDDLKIGHLNWSGFPNLYFNGTIDEAAVYSKALSAQEVSEHYAANAAKFAEWAPKDSGYALEFSGAQDFGHVNVSSFPDITENITINASIYPANLSGYRGIAGKWETNKGYLLLQYDDDLHFYIGDGASQYEVYTIQNVLAANTWQNVSARYNTETGNVTLYVNGQKKLTSGPTIPAGTKISTTTKNLIIGAYESAGILSGHFQGRIDDVKILNFTAI